jgi:hypothetical protein
MSQALQNIHTQLQQLRAGQISVHDFSEYARAQQLGDLPARYTEVLHQLLDRLESSALFSEESCSFSQRDLLDSLQTWLDKAQAQTASAAK